MALNELRILGYRSLRNVVLPLSQLNVVTGSNGSGKSNLYRALWLIAQICEGSFARTIAREGGLLSALWAGPRLNKKPVRMSLGFMTNDFNFELSCGFPQPSPSLFAYDPEIKEEVVWHGRIRKPTTTLLERKAGMTWIRDDIGKRVEYPLVLGENESVLSQLREPQRFPELFSLRDEVRGWRFYHGFRTDDESPIRSPQVSVRTPVLSHDGSDLAAALQTILEIGDSQQLMASIASAFPGRNLMIDSNSPGDSPSPRATELSVALYPRGCRRPMLARELSDGTLKYLCLVAALLSPRPPVLIALNEPEASLHPDLLPPLAQLIVNASELSQVWVSTHSQILVDAIQQISGTHAIRLRLEEDETKIVLPEECET
ncbi:MAG: AAA family ATPase [Planctomycetota bacterium]|nr:AAA family ATPase [Planctomycetota bacterium]MDA1211617.1 AAA family ATPase [Planctomycetota bacterium]